MSVRRGKRATRLILTGHVSLDRAVELHGAASKAAKAGRDVVLDWSQAEHLSAAALQVLLALRAALAARGRKLLVNETPAPLLRALEVAGAAELAAGPELPSEVN